MAGFASGVQAGLAMSNQWMDTYEKTKRRKLNEDVDKERKYAKYSLQTADKLRGLSEETNEQGLPKYQFDIDPGSTQYRVREIAYPQARPDIEGYSPSWLGRDTGLAPQQGAEVSTSPVPMDGLDVRTVLDSNAPGYERDRTPISSGLGFYPAMGAEAADTAPRAYTDLTVSGPEYSPDLRISRPDDSAAYRGLTRELGPAREFAPDQVKYFGREYERDKFTPEMQQAAKMEAYARVAEQMGDPDRAMQMRASAMNMRKGQLDLEDAERTATKKRTLSEIDAGAKDFWKTQVGDREPKFEDNLALTQWRAGRLIEAGMVDEAEALGDKMLARVGNRLNVEKAERDVRLPAAIMAARSGDLKPITEVYNKFVHDGAQVEKVTKNPDGSITVHRRALSGADLPDYTFPTMQEFTRSLEDLLKPGAFEDYTQQSFMNNLRTQESKRQDKELTLREKQVGYEGQRVGIAARNAAAAQTIPVIDSQGKIGLMRTDNIKYDDKGMAVFPEGVQPYKGYQASQPRSQLSKEDTARYNALLRTDKWKRAKTLEDKARLLQEEGLDPASVGMGDAGLSGWD
jgi:hypothetical protein